MDTVLKLRELRAHAGMSQEDVARLSRVGVKTISSFESGARISSMKLSQLEAILATYKISLAQFFSRSIEHDLAPWESSETAADVLVRRLDALPAHARTALIEKIAAMLDAAEAVLPRRSQHIPPAVSQHASLH
jgi:transcriptional regulator with XRE-family HTH domain